MILQMAYMHEYNFIASQHQIYQRCRRAFRNTWRNSNIDMAFEEFGFKMNLFAKLMIYLMKDSSTLNRDWRTRLSNYCKNDILNNIFCVDTIMYCYTTFNELVEADYKYQSNWQLTEFIKIIRTINYSNSKWIMRGLYNLEILNSHKESWKPKKPGLRTYAIWCSIEHSELQSYSIRYNRNLVLNLN
jgi:hypothetical protein